MISQFDKNCETRFFVFLKSTLRNILQFSRRISYYKNIFVFSSRPIKRQKTLSKPGILVREKPVEFYRRNFTFEREIYTAVAFRDCSNNIYIYIYIYPGV